MLLLLVHQFTRHAVKWVKRITIGPALTVFSARKTKSAKRPSGNAARKNMVLKVCNCVRLTAVIS